MHQLFASKHISKIKTLTEGEGCPVENKYQSPFTGFIGARTLITCNALVAPFVPPSSSKSGFDKIQYELEKEAMMERAELIQFDTKFDKN